MRENNTPNLTLGYNTARDRMYTILDNREGNVIGVYTYFEMPVDPNSLLPRQNAYDGNGDIRESLPSEGYDNASGDAQVFMNLGYKYFTIGNINTSAFEQLVLTLGVYSSSTTPLTIEYRTEGNGLWTELSYNERLSSGSWSRITIEDSALPAAETLAIRFSK